MTSVIGPGGIKQLSRSSEEPPLLVPNIAQLLERNAVRFGNRIAFSEKKGNEFQSVSWKKLYTDILTISYNLRQQDFRAGDKLVLFSPNRLEMLELELAVMASGGIALPIFAGFKMETVSLLIRHSDAKFLAVSGKQQLEQISGDLFLKKIISFDELMDKRFPALLPFSDLLKPVLPEMSALCIEAHPDEICLNMYTSGTMGIPKCVQLTHRNILSQQSALNKVWDINENDRFLSYLPWHHSFGGIFELFAALCNGASISLESSYGKDPKSIMQNWKEVKPTLFFSVPRVYQSLVELTKENKEAENLFFHSGLKFIFTAAAPLPEKLSDEFEKRNIRVLEGWGLTETSPCCTVTDHKMKRMPGVVGKPIPGVTLRLAEDGEIQVKGPNVMPGYYKNEDANREAFTKDGWFRTGDIGSITPEGLKLIARRDRIFKLTNGEKIIPTDLEKVIEAKCHYISFAVVAGTGREYPVALIFPNKKILEQPDYEITPMERCFCPRTIEELGKCLTGCLHDANCGIWQKFSRIHTAIIIDDELSVEKNTLTSSLKVSPGNVIKTYSAHLENLFGGNFPVREKVYVIELEEPATSWPGEK